MPLTASSQKTTMAKKIVPAVPKKIRNPRTGNQSMIMFEQAIMAMHETRSSAQNGYEKVISALEGVVKELMGKIDFLNKDRDILMRENYDLRRKN